MASTISGMSGGTLQSLAQGDSRDTFLMTGGTIIGAFEDGDTARMTGGSIGRVDMKLDDNLFDLSGGQILGNLVTGFGTDTIIVSGGRVGGNVSVSGGNDSIRVTGGEIVGEIRASAGDDTLIWDGGGIIRSAILMGEDHDSATLRNLAESTLALTPGIDGGNGNDLLTFDGTTSAGSDRYRNWETMRLNNGSRFDLDGTSAGRQRQRYRRVHCRRQQHIDFSPRQHHAFHRRPACNLEQRRGDRPERRQYAHQ